MPHEFDGVINHLQEAFENFTNAMNEHNVLDRSPEARNAQTGITAAYNELVRLRKQHPHLTTTHPAKQTRTKKAKV